MISTPLSVADPTLQLLQQQQMLQNGMNDPLSVNQMALAQQMASLQMQQQLLQQQFTYPVRKNEGKHPLKSHSRMQPVFKEA